MNQMDKFRLDNKVAIVAGAGVGLGRATAITFVQRGAQVALIDINGDTLQTTAQLVEKEGGTCKTYVCDLTDRRKLRNVVDNIFADSKKVDILANIAGIFEVAPFLEMSDQSMDRMMDVNFNGYYNTMKLVIPHMVERRYGRIVSVSSTGAREGSAFGGGHYSAAKGAVISFSVSLAREFGSYGITINVVCPGPMATPMGEAVKQSRGEAAYQAYIQRSALKRRGEPEEVAAAIAFLASDAASYITGQALNVCGGMRFD